MIRKMGLGFVFALCGFMATAEPITIAALGDSLTQGYGLTPQNGFVPQLQAWLTEQGANVVLINAGVSGDTTAGGAARAAWTLTPDVDAMIVALGGNDLLRGLPPEVSHKNLATILHTAQEANVDVLLIGLQAPTNYGADYKSAFDAIYPDLAGQYDTLYAVNFLAAILGPEGQIFGELLQADGIHPNTQGVTRIVSNLGPNVLELVRLVESRQ